jgi:hypothetical protein
VFLDEIMLCLCLPLTILCDYIDDFIDACRINWDDSVNEYKKFFDTRY